MRVASTSINDLLNFGPPFLHWARDCEATQLAKDIELQLGDRVKVRLLNGAAAKNLEELGKELGRSTGTSVGGNLDAFHDALHDPHWFSDRNPRPTVYIVADAARILSELPSGMAAWGSKAEVMSHTWATPIREGEPWDHEPVPLHFIHCASALPKDAPNMNRFDGAGQQ